MFNDGSTLTDIGSVGRANCSNKQFGPSRFLTPQEQQQLSRIRPWKLVSALVCDVCWITCAILLAEFTAHGGIYLLAVMVIGARQAGIGSIALHDGVHHLLVRNRKWNDWIGRLLSLLVSTPLLTSFASYRTSHFDHHRATNLPNDPDLILCERFYHAPWWKAAVGVMLPLTGLLFALAIVRYPFKDGRQNPVGVLFLVTLTGLLVMSLATANDYGQLFFWYWILPLGTWGVFVNQLRALAEHYPQNEYGRDGGVPEVFRTRDVLCSWFDKLFVVTRGVNYHLSHHLCPQVPFYNLASLQATLAANQTYRQYAHVTLGYHRVIWEYIRRPAESVEQPLVPTALQSSAT